MIRKWFFVLFVIAVVGSVTERSSAQSYPDLPGTEYIVTKSGEKIRIEDGMDLSERDLSGIEIHRGYGELRDVNFSGADLTDANFAETTFVRCSFRGATLRGADFSEYVRCVDCSFRDTDLAGVRFTAFEPVGCNFTDASVNDVDSWLTLNVEQLHSTRSWKENNLRDISFGCTFGIREIAPISLKGMDICNSALQVRPECDLEDSLINGCNFVGGSRGIGYNDRRGRTVDCPRTGTLEAILETKNGKKKNLSGVTFKQFDFSDADFSGINLSNSHFRDCRLDGADFTDSIISRTRFTASENPQSLQNLFGTQTPQLTLSLDQIKSTWNYKNDRMEGIHLSDEVRAALDAEK